MNDILRGPASPGESLAPDLDTAPYPCVERARVPGDGTGQPPAPAANADNWFAQAPAASAATSISWRQSFLTTLDLCHAGRRQVRIECEWHGPPDGPVVLVVGGASSNRHVCASALFPEAGWWPEVVGRGGGIDTTECRVLGVNWLHAAGVAIDSVDQVQAIAATLAYFGIDRVASVVGYSYGALVGLQFAASHGSRLCQLLAIASAEQMELYLHDEAIAAITTPSVLVAITEAAEPTDHLWELAHSLSSLDRLHRIAASPGLDGYLNDMQAVGEIVKATMRDGLAMGCPGAARLFV